MIDRRDWKWFGSPGHYICRRWCRFHLSTAIGDTLVSTVGELVHPSDSGGSEKAEAKHLAEHGFSAIGQAKYETMSFKIEGACECGCGLPDIDGTQIDFDSYNDAAAATQGHYKICEIVAERQ